MAISTRWAIVVSVIYTEKLVVFIGRAGQTVSLPIAFGVIFFFFYNIDFVFLRDVISLVFLWFSHF